MIVERDLVTVEDGAGRVAFIYDPDDPTPRVRAFHMVNNTSQPMLVSIYRSGENLFDPEPGLVCEPGFDKSMAIPAADKFRIDVTVVSPTKVILTNADVSVQHPYGQTAP